MGAHGVGYYACTEEVVVDDVAFDGVHTGFCTVM